MAGLALLIWWRIPPSTAPAWNCRKRCARSDDFRLARDHWAPWPWRNTLLWRHPPGGLRWLTVARCGSLALGDARDYGWMLINIGRYLFFLDRVDEAVSCWAAGGDF